MNKLIIALALATVSLTACKSDNKMSTADANEPAAKPECCEGMKPADCAGKSCDGAKAKECDSAKTCPMTGEAKP
jgi:hypothetical protein